MAKQLALVVHGIGEQQAGQTVDELVGGLTGRSPLSVETNHRLLQEPKPRSAKKEDDPAPVLFPCHIARVRHPKGETVFAEVYWADLSGGNSGAIRTIYDIVKLSLGLGHIARRGAEALYGETHWLTRLTRLVVHLLHGPITACNAILLMAMALLLFTPLGTSPNLAVLITGLAALGIGVISLIKLWSRHLLRIFGFWLSGLGAFLSLIVLLTVFRGSQGSAEMAFLGYACGPQNDCLVPFYATVIVFIVSIASEIILAAVPVMIIAQWLNEGTSERKDPRSLFHVVTAFMVVMWLLIVAVLWAFALRSFDERLAGFGIDVGYITEGTTQIGLLFAGLLALAAAGCAVFAKVLRWRAEFRAGRDPGEPPRLILNPLIRSVLSWINIVLGASMVATLAAYLGYPVLGWLDDISGQLAPYALIAALLIATLYTSSSDAVARGIGVAKDVVAYFKREPLGKGWHDPLRERMQARFQTVAGIMRDLERPDEIVLVSHSLGTMIATDAIREANTYAKLVVKGGRAPSLVTMGSPYSHLFTHYFGRFFPEPDHLQSKLHQWLNVYRADDFVGTRVGQSGCIWPENRKVPPRGHTGYWTDPDVVSILTSSVFNWDINQEDKVSDRQHRQGRRG